MFSDELDAWEATASLLDFALVRTRGDGRLAMAEPIRAYAHVLLAQQGAELRISAATPGSAAELNSRSCHACGAGTPAWPIRDLRRACR
jgi:hypothetical protein